MAWFYNYDFNYREIELRENLVGTGFINPPDEKSEFNNRITVVGKFNEHHFAVKWWFVLNISIFRCFIWKTEIIMLKNYIFIGEIVSTTGFDAEK